MKILVHDQAHHVGETLARAARMREFQVVADLGHGQELLFAACDVVDHSNLDEAQSVFHALALGTTAPLIHVSQVPPGTTRKWAGDRKDVFYQVDTIIMSRAVQRARAPEQFIVGCADPGAPLPLAYQEYLAVHDCPVLQMSYESAEVAKLGINYVLAKQVEAASELVTACGAVGADYPDVERALRGDARIGQHAYLRPGRTNQHLQRDVDTVVKLVHEVIRRGACEAADG